MARKPSRPGNSEPTNVIASLKSGVRRLVSGVIWIVLIAAVVWGVWALFLKPSGAGLAGRSEPDGVLETYTNFVQDYVPPSALSPTQGTVSNWLSFFDGDSQRWFRENVDDLAAIGMRVMEESPQDVARARREMEAMRFVLSRGPLRGGITRNLRIDEENDRAALEVVTGTASARVEMTRGRSGWVFTDMMGMRESLDREVAQQRARAAVAP